MSSEKPHVSLVICGHVDAGKSTTTGRLLFELGGVDEREMEKLKKEAEARGKASFAFAYYMDRQVEERERGVTISCTTKEFFTEKYHYTIIDAPGHRDFIKNMITGAAQADVAVLMVPSDGNFTVALSAGDHKAGEVQGQSRQHARLLNLLGVKQICVGINKMDCDMAKYSQERYDEIKEEVKNTLKRVGWNRTFVDTSVPIVPISGWMGDNLITKSTNMNWWKGMDVKNQDGEMIHVDTILDVLNNFVTLPKRNDTADMRMPVSGIYTIKGVGNVITGRVEQGLVETNAEVVFIPTHTSSKACAGKVFSIEMHHKKVNTARTGDNVGLNVKNLSKENMPRVGDVMIHKSDNSLKACTSFKAQVQTLDIPNEVKLGYSPIAFVRCGRSACKMTEIHWKMGRETGGKKVDGPFDFIKANEAAEITWKPMHPFVVEDFKKCEGLSRVAFLDSNTAVMLGKVTAVNF